MKSFARVFNAQLDDFIKQSANTPNTTLFGLVGIGKYIMFYKMMLLSGESRLLFDRPMYWWDDCQYIQEWFNHFKEYVPLPPALEEFFSQYYYVVDSKYYFDDNSICTEYGRPENTWVYNDNG